MPRLRDRMAAWLVPPPVSVTIPAIGRLPRLIAWLGRISWATRMTGSSPSVRARAPSAGPSGGWTRQVRADPRDHVADVGHPLAEVVVLDPGEGGRVALEDHLERREGRQPLRLDQRADLGQQRLVVDDLEVALEDVGLGRRRAAAATLGRSPRARPPTPPRRGRTARSRPGPAPASASVCGSPEPKTESTRYATPTTTPGLTAIPLCIARPVYPCRSPDTIRAGRSPSDLASAASLSRCPCLPSPATLVPQVAHRLRFARRVASEFGFVSQSRGAADGPTSPALREPDGPPHLFPFQNLRRSPSSC